MCRNPVSQHPGLGADLFTLSYQMHSSSDRCLAIGSADFWIFTFAETPRATEMTGLRSPRLFDLHRKSDMSQRGRRQTISRGLGDGPPSENQV
jgi:hypothetical protein